MCAACAVSEMRCRLLHLIPHGRYTCTRGFEVDSRCDFTCSPGYRFEGEYSRTCLSGASWSGTQPVCTGEQKESIHAVHQSVCGLGHVRSALFAHPWFYILEVNAVTFSSPQRLKERTAFLISVHLFISDMDPPRIKCPLSRLKAAEPGKLTAVVNWDPPVVSDTADKSLEYVFFSFAGQVE